MSDLDWITKELDQRKAAIKTKAKQSHYPTPGLITTEIAMKHAECVKADPKLAKSHLTAIKANLEKGKIKK